MAQRTPTDTSPIDATPAPDPRRWVALGVIVIAPFMAIFDQFVVNVAIPTMQRDLHASFAQIQFVIAGYALAFAITLVTGGRLGDIYGRKRLFMLGMTGFTLASALCGLAPDPSLLVIARLVQGFGAALMSPQVLAIISVTFPARERAAALSVFGAVTGLGSLAGQALGGLLIQADLWGLGWRTVFLVNVPVGIGALAAASFLLAESRSDTARRLDLGGVALISFGLLLLVFPLVAGRDAGWPAWAWLCLVASVPVIGGFVLFERWLTARGGSPLVVLGLFRERAFVAGLVVAFLFGAANPAMFFTLALALQIGLHFSAFAAGLTFAPAPIGYFIAATLTAKLAPRFGARLITFGLLLKAAAWAVIGVIVHRSGAVLHGPELIAPIFAEGFAAGMTSPPLIGAVLSGIRGGDAGSASGVLTTFQQVAGAMGVALIGVIFFAALAGDAAGVAARSTPPLRQALGAAGFPATETDRTLADYAACVEARARSKDPATTPPPCAAPSLHAQNPTAAAALTAALTDATARTYADAYGAAMYANVGMLLVATPFSLLLPAPRRPRRTAH